MERTEVLDICIDAGHFGRYNKCPAIPEYSEAEVMWKLHLLEKKYLEQLGHRVTLTRSNQAVDLGLTERGELAKGHKLFMSDHTNAVGSNMNENVDYVVVYHLQADDKISYDEESKEIAELLAKAIAEVMGVHQDYRATSRQSDRDKNGDGVMNDNYLGVLHGARLAGVAGVLCEHSFHTNSEVVRWLMNDENLDALARRKAEVIHEYYTGKVADFGTKEEEKPTTNTKILHRVQIGAFGVKENALNFLDKVKKVVPEAFVTVADGLYKIQVGAYSNVENAENMRKKMVNAGYKDAFITTKSGTFVSLENPKKSVEEVAREVLKGLWGNGTARMKALENAGYDYDVVQAKVNELARR